MSSFLSNFSIVDEIYIISHSNNKNIYVGQASVPNTNISEEEKNTDISSYSVNWNTNGYDSFINIWGCNAGNDRESIAQSIANASGSMVSAYTSFLSFDENGKPFSKWYRGGKKVWFAPLEPGSVVEAASPSGLNYAFHW